jgi:hypothetical protein
MPPLTQLVAVLVKPTRTYESVCLSGTRLDSRHFPALDGFQLPGTLQCTRSRAVSFLYFACIWAWKWRRCRSVRSGHWVGSALLFVWDSIPGARENGCRPLRDSFLRSPSLPALPCRLSHAAPFGLLFHSSISPLGQEFLRRGWKARPFKASSYCELPQGILLR